MSEGVGSPTAVEILSSSHVSSLISFILLLSGPPFYVPESEIKSLFGE